MVQPYGIHDNPFSVLDVADIVYICPVNTGFSRIIKANKENKEGTDVSTQGASRGNRQNASSKGASDRFIFKSYRSGHMIYVRQEDLKQGNEDIRQFILSQIPKDGTAIKY